MVLSPPVNETKLGDLMIYVNNVTDGWFSNLTLLAMFVIIFFILSKESAAKGAVAGGFITTVFAVGFWTLGVGSLFAVVIAAVITSIGAIGLYYEDK